MKIPQRLKDFVSRRDVAKVLATVNSDGSPNVGPKASTQVFDDESLVYGEFVGKRHFENVQREQRISIAVMDWEKREGYRFVGQAEVHKSGPTYENVVARLPGPPRAVVRLLVERIDILSPKQAGETLPPE
ncbi:MAG: pyridoxamine 5'-phosphate oxidase family protein [Deltaproteobacteria bacterium]|nr:pyridoxamine 5'-phosphate oxidase family protein [Deltaproteobacteria bacterium]